VAGQWLLIALPAAVVALVALGGGQAVESSRFRIRHTPELLIWISW
jgi:hypothetical protein